MTDDNPLNLIIGSQLTTIEISQDSIQLRFDGSYGNGYVRGDPKNVDLGNPLIAE